MTKNENIDLLEQVWSNVNEHFYDQKFQGIDWDKKYMAGIVQLLKIGKVIGRQTPGQMLWGNGYLLNDSIALAIPIYKMEYPNGFNPENNGIKPDIEIGLTQNDLLNDKDTQLDEAIRYLEKEIGKQ